jgi:cytochrome oxidase Cu insertion factor (SCO1/SenC/PrrC family)
MTEESIQVKRKNPYTIWFVVASFVLPVVLAYFTFYFVEITSFTNKGEILNPIVDIAALELTDEKGEIIPRDTLTYKWRFISFVGSECDEACKKRLYETRQVYATLGKDRHRVLRVIVHLEPAGEKLKALIETEYPNVLNMNGNAKAINAAFDGSSKLDENELYIMDPVGNVMMRFTQDQPMKDIQTDVRKLLKASQIG